MALNYIWTGFFVIAFVVACIRFAVTGDTEIFKAIIDSTFSSSKSAVMDIALPLTGVMVLWLGLMNIGERAGAVNFLARMVGPFFTRLFPELPRKSPVFGQMLMNFSANMLGLDNAATPLGLKAMQGLQDENPRKDTASNAQIMFLVINTSGLTVIPVSILAQRAILGAANPADIFIPVLIATAISTLVGMIVVALRQRINLLDPVMIAWIGGIIAAIGALTWWIGSLEKEQIETVSMVGSNLLLILIIGAFIAGAIIRKVNVYEAFIDGAKNGFDITVKIIPYLVGMLVGIAVFRASGAMDDIIDGLAWLFGTMGLDTNFVPALPTAFMKPLSGSGAKAMMVETMQHYGPDSFVGRLSCLFQGAADTTFYIIALYFGSVGIRKTRYSVTAGLIADLAGVIAAIVLAYLFFA
ncbi:MAG: spore maturation protein [Bacteroidales bacterium]|jgi:spore maturation protein SpmA|nr:spore maturation protein [Bacteroidales bacterium]